MTRAFKVINLLGAFLGLLQARAHEAALSAAPQIPADATMNQDAGRGGALCIMLRLKNGRQLPFIVDTGSPITVLDKSLERDLGRRLDTVPMGLVGQAMRREGVYAAPRLYIGEVLLMTGSNVATREFKRREFKRAKGILGMDCLQHYCIQLDFTGGKVRFLNRERMEVSDLGKAFPMMLLAVGPKKQSVRPLIYHAALSGNNTNLIVDTGCVIDGLMAKNESKVEGSERLDLPKCTWDDQAYTDVSLGVVGQFNALGLRFLARHLVTLDFQGRMMYLKRKRNGPLAIQNQGERPLNSQHQLLSTSPNPASTGANRQ
jgi:hypothetical protein